VRDIGFFKSDEESSRLGLLVFAALAVAQSDSPMKWKHLSTKHGDLPAPNAGTEQTSATVFDIDKDGVNDS
jgi:hypothetical protein